MGADQRQDAGEDRVPVSCYSGLVHIVSFIVASLCRFRLALLRHVAEQNRSRLVPQIDVPQDSARRAWRSRAFSSGGSASSAR